MELTDLNFKSPLYKSQFDRLKASGRTFVGVHAGGRSSSRNGFSVRDVAFILGISPIRVEQIERKALAKCYLRFRQLYGDEMEDVFT